MKAALALLLLCGLAAPSRASNWLSLFHKSADTPADARDDAPSGQVSDADRTRGLCLLRAKARPAVKPLAAQGQFYSDKVNVDNAAIVAGNIEALEGYIKAAEACRPLFSADEDRPTRDALEDNIGQARGELFHQYELAKQYPTRT